ncbi:biopolymer transporter ExbD, partial [Duncaniella muris]
MALKRQNTMMAAFSMASMTDVIFLLLIFFMVTSTFVFPTALEVNLPESSKQTALKPSTRVYIDKEGVIYATADQSEPVAMDENTLLGFLQSMSANAADGGDNYIAVYADEEVTYGALVRVLDLGAQNNLKMVLATK